MSEHEFMECAACAAKPGHPTLCPSCLSNRSAIAALMLPRVVQYHTDTFTVPEGLVTLCYPVPPMSLESTQVVEKWQYLQIQKMKRGVDWEAKGDG